jgi:hypothetical protein
VGRACAILETFLIVAGLAVLFFFLPHHLFGDDNSRFDDIQALLNGGGLTDDRYSLVMPVVSSPVLLLGTIVKGREWWAAHFNTLVAAVGVLVAFGLLRGRVESRLLRRTVLLLCFASFLTDRLRDYNAETFTATLVVLGILAVATGRHVTAGWAAIVVGVVNTPAAVVAMALLVAFQAARTRRLRHLLPLAAAVVLIMAEAWIRRGSPFDTGYGGDHGFRTVMPYSGRPGFSYPFVLGALAILVSFGRGLVFFMPGLLLWLDRGTRRLAGGPAVWLMLLFTAGLVLVYAKWWAWYGGVGWGPRFFLVAAVPASYLLAVRIGRLGESAAADLLALAVLFLSSWVACAGAIANLDALGVCTATGASPEEQLCWFTPDFSSLWVPVRQFPELSGPTVLTALYCGAVFAYLATPLLISLARALRPRCPWTAGWQI